MSSLTQSAAWQALNQHYDSFKHAHMRDLFAEDQHRFENFSCQAAGLFLDFSKNRISQETLQKLLELAKQERVEQKRDEMFSGAKINYTEKRSVLHTALRNSVNHPIFEGKETSDESDVKPGIEQVLAKMKHFSRVVRSGEWTGYTGKKITDVVNLGIGGSDLGPKMVVKALTPFNQNGEVGINAHFISNLDGSQIADTLKKLDPETTLFVVASKTFTTPETMFNASTARAWFVAASGDSGHIAKHFVAVSTNKEGVTQFGIDENNMFEFWDWVGGRYSLWSAIGLSIALAIGMENFERLLQGAEEMDRHFQTAPLNENMPVIMALIGIWYNNFFDYASHAVLAYDEYLQYFPSFLQQLDMESNGKHINHDNETVDYNTGPIIWGEQGINGQHAFYQLLHQGSRIVPTDFMAALNTFNPKCGHHPMLLSNFFAQTEAMMRGKTEQQVRDELTLMGKTDAQIEQLQAHKVFDGNRPSNTLLMDELNPETIGALVALYEHKVFVQGCIWRINSFDQWGVELGKQLAKTIQMELNGNEPVTGHDSSTNGLINYYKQRRDLNGNVLLSSENDWLKLQDLLVDEFKK